MATILNTSGVIEIYAPSGTPNDAGTKLEITAGMVVVGREIHDAAAERTYVSYAASKIGDDGIGQTILDLNERLDRGDPDGIASGGLKRIGYLHPETRLLAMDDEETAREWFGYGDEDTRYMQCYTHATEYGEITWNVELAASMVGTRRALAGAAGALTPSILWEGKSLDHIAKVARRDGDPAQIAAADASKPGLCAFLKAPDGLRCVLIDGNHRAAKAHETTGHYTAIILTAEENAATIMRKPDSIVIS